MNDSKSTKGIIFLGVIFAALISGATRIFTAESYRQEGVSAAVKCFIDKINRDEEDSGSWIINTNYARYNMVQCSEWIESNQGYEGWAGYRGTEEDPFGVFKTERLTPKKFWKDRPMPEGFAGYNPIKMDE